MKLALRIAVVPFICLLCFALFAGAASDQDAAFTSLRESWILAFKMGDPAKAASLFTPDATIMPQGFPSTVGRKAIEQFYSDAFVLLSLRDFQIHSKERHLDGPNTLRDHGTYTSTWIPKDGSAPYSLTGRYLIIAKHQPDGRWLIAWEMHTIESKIPFDQL